MHAAPEVKAEVHRKRVDFQKPRGRIGHKVRRNDIARIGFVGVQGLFNHFAGEPLLFTLRRIKTHAHRVLLSALLIENTVGSELGIGQCLLHVFKDRLIDFDGGLTRTHLHGRRFAVEIRERIKRRHNEHNGNQDVFPKSVAVHRKSNKNNPPGA